MALAQYNRMERSLSKYSELRTQYHDVLNEYIALDHAEETSSREISFDDKFNSFYLPHHAVVRPEHKSIKVRIVFNASRKTKSGYSLNDILHTGPTLQSDLTSVILNWRKYQYVFCGDIQKMYRQILVHPHDRPYQRILFKPSDNNSIKDYQLKTVTFGINCAPFLAIRTLLQLASDVQATHPIVARILKHETYVDDILSGGFSIQEALKARNDLIDILKNAGFPLKKIIANDPQLLAHIPPQDLYDSEFLRFHESSSTKTLGIKWNALSDSFTYSINPIQSEQTMTKRMVLSSIAQLFDPAGWIAPVIIRAKILMQQLWLEEVGWDDNLGPESQSTWNRLVFDFPHINSISIPRWIQCCPTDTLEIHGFSDSSQAAYCACVYLRCQTNKSVVFSNLLVAKSKVAPLKPLNSINYVTSTFDFEISSITLWTDSSIVLGWLSKPPWTWETYIANRTSQIHELVPGSNWRHVPTQDNPADLGTRGCRPQDLTPNSLWFNGPKWLTQPHSTWPKRNPLVAPELGKRVNVQTYHNTNDDTDILLRFSPYNRSLRVISYMFRFYNNCLSRRRSTIKISNPFLTHKKVTFVKSRLIILSQKKFYPDEYSNLLESKPINDKSQLKCLNPFLSHENIMRVNGRLADSSLPYNERFPIILSGNSRFSHLYLLNLHQLLAHADCTLMCRMVQTEFNISRLKPRVKAIIHKCRTCVIFKQKSCSQIMAPLPSVRCELSPPFNITGVDFAGPFELKSSTIEGILNSRPISAVSEHPADLTALTPGHFLKGSPIMSFPETPSQNLSLLNRWTKLKALHHQFAIRWKEDYLKSLHKRYKWKNSGPNLKIGDLVVVMDDLLPPSDWRLGRIVNTHHGSDNNIRVADIKVASGIITRPIVKLCYLLLLDQTSPELTS
ncbi:uncharacterized protein LOC142235542 [Haematobia irritans]|uniref:uncharacterized protein LOC142235542 n=1 Tax=Haematobia irritans TaxID=7368 RepID=UPI003F505B77